MASTLLSLLPSRGVSKFGERWSGVLVRFTSAAQASDDDRRVGINIVRRALRARRMRASMAIRGRQNLDSGDYAFGYDTQTGDFSDLVSKQGAIDLAKIVRTGVCSNERSD
jgi:hypothetical protein